MDKSKIAMKQVLAYNDAVGYLEALLKSFREGRIVVRKGEEFVTLTPPENVEIEVSAKQKKDKEKFSLELSWTCVEEGGEPLVITDKLPEPAQEPCDAVVTPAPEAADAADAATKGAPAKDKPAEKTPAKGAAKTGAGK